MSAGVTAGSAIRVTTRILDGGDDSDDESYTPDEEEEKDKNKKDAPKKQCTRGKSSRENAFSKTRTSPIKVPELAVKITRDESNKVFIQNLSSSAWRWILTGKKPLLFF